MARAGVCLLLFTWTGGRRFDCSQDVLLTPPLFHNFMHPWKKSINTIWGGSSAVSHAEKAQSETTAEKTTTATPFKGSSWSLVWRSWKKKSGQPGQWAFAACAEAPHKSLAVQYGEGLAATYEWVRSDSSSCGDYVLYCCCYVRGITAFISFSALI